MHKHRYILAVWLSALVTLQSLAAVAMPCSGPGAGSASAMTSMEDSTHHAHHAADAAAEADSNACCDAGYCSQGGCLSIAAAASDLIPAAVELAHPPALSLPRSAPLRCPNTLFRPPSA
ncbi:hypothetical protein E2F43_16055 [Seongchinamella unica]|uniref:CopL family metal-binding regulatory protein n=1 Tax=Seongchinamella unica TaxID=2547392 RepID=A0A4R5LNF3_9GAMM|nr:hypothetical protein [Seongchinamella unica]TDG11879.1 hypothetical protein E2F43_16055 [Seongchinamella unica]